MNQTFWNEHSSKTSVSRTEIGAVKEAVDSIVSASSAHPKHTGLVVGIVKHGQSSIFGYGQVSEASAELLGRDTLFEIGSVTKVLTTALLSVAVADGLVSLNDPVRELVPALSNLPSEITLVRLATHTSGLPKMPSNLGRSMRRSRRNPFAAYTTADLLEYLSGYKSRQDWKSTEQIHYSNVGMALLGYILAQQMGTSYEQAVINKVCDPLDLTDTRITLNPKHKQRLAAPHRANGKPGDNWDIPAFEGAAALHSTANDLMKFLAANLGIPRTALTDVLQACHDVRPGRFPRPGYLRRLFSRLYLHETYTGDYEQNMGLGWHIGRLFPDGKQVHWRHGATGGYRAFAGFVKAANVGCVVLANRSLGMLDVILNLTSADRVGFGVLEYLSASDG